jgi:hypothetical protein
VITAVIAKYARFGGHVLKRTSVHGMTFVATVLLLVSSFPAFGQQPAGSDCTTLKYQKRTSAWLCGQTEICAGDICGRPSTYDFDEQFDVVLRNKQGKNLASKKLSYEQRKFCFDGYSDGDYELAFILYQKGVSQPARVFPARYKRNANKPNDKVYMVEVTCPPSSR